MKKIKQSEIKHNLEDDLNLTIERLNEVIGVLQAKPNKNLTEEIVELFDGMIVKTINRDDLFAILKKYKVEKII